jgi:KaiC/GvpD/RAD55 family RecA-like ATPase
LLNDSHEKQKLLLEYLLSAEETFTLSQPILSPTFFDMDLGKALNFMMSHADDYHRLPSPEMIMAETGVKLEKKDDASDPKRVKWVLDEVENYCRIQKVIEAVTWAGDKIASGQVDGIVDPIKDAVMLSLHRDMGLRYFEEPKKRLEKMMEVSNVSTGFRSLDYLLFGGVEPGTLTLFAGGPGAGKSYTLSNLALNFMESGHNVVYISLELSEKLIAKRFDSMITGIAFKDIFANIDKVDKTIKMKSKNAGELWIKVMPKNETSIRGIESYIREIEIKHGFGPTVLIIDYMDLMCPKNSSVDINNLFLKDKYVSEDLTQYLEDNDVIGFTASQLGRSSIGEEEQHLGMTAGGISKANTAHNFFSIYRDEKLKERDAYKFTALKTRTSDGLGKSFFLKYNPASLRYRDPTEDELTELNKKSKSSGVSPKKITGDGGSITSINRLEEITKKIKQSPGT